MTRIATGAEQALDTQLAELGFAPNQDRNGWLRDDAALVCDGVWHRLTVTQPPAAGPLDLLWDQMGRPGLWRTIRTGAENSSLVRVCDLPPCLVPSRSGASSATSARRLLSDGPTGGSINGEFNGEFNHALQGGVEPVVAGLTWLLATAAGVPPPGWVSPPLEEIETQLDPERLVVRSGSHTVRGSMIHQPSRLALVFPLRQTLPEEMPPARLSWLREILHDAQTRWRLVRLGFDQRGGGVQAEVDLTGVPGALVSPMVEAALEALRWVVGWVLAPVAVATDLRLQSRLLARSPVPTRESALAREPNAREANAREADAREIHAREPNARESKKGVVATPSSAGSQQEVGSR